ncbi:MAG: FAD binding domain-containing protein [Solirubrobacteraceae bacterium]|nr:FAD binding domain-containing protein [Solirubrobacteraceae bacterium]
MELIQPISWEDALAAKAAYPDARAIRGGTDLMIELGAGDRLPATILDLGRVVELAEWSLDDGHVVLGAGVTFTELIDELSGELPALAMAARTVGSPQIRNRGTVGGNLGTASPAGDAHPPLLATDAQVKLASARGARWIGIGELFAGPKRTTLEPDELIECVRMPRASGSQQFSKIGTRNAMVISVCSFALAIDPSRRRVGTGIGSAGPVPLVAEEAGRFLEGVLTEADAWESGVPLGESEAARFAELVSAAACPIDDVRGTADYRRHALAVLARRALGWARGVRDELIG